MVFEHPVAATSWGSAMMDVVMRMPGMEVVNFDFCVLGMRSTMRNGTEAPARKRTKVLTNSKHIAAALRCCQCQGGHEHAMLEGGRPKACERYPEAFCDLIVKGLQREMSDARWLLELEKQIDITPEVEKLIGLVEDEQDSITIASYGTFSTGINIHNIHNIVLASPSKSRIRVLQSIGRGLRQGSNKDSVLIFDIADDLTFKSRPNFTLNHFQERINIYNAEQFNYEISKIKLR